MTTLVDRAWQHILEYEANESLNVSPGKRVPLLVEVILTARRMELSVSEGQDLWSRFTTYAGIKN